MEFNSDNSTRGSLWLTEHYSYWHALLTKTLRFRGLTVQEAEDIAQDSILDFWRQNCNLPEPPPVQILYVIARHKWISLLRKRNNWRSEAREVSLESGNMPVPAVSSGEGALHARQYFFEVIRSLTSIQAMIFRFKLNGYSRAEIAARVNRTPDQVKHEWAKIETIVRHPSEMSKIKHEGIGEASL